MLLSSDPLSPFVSTESIVVLLGGLGPAFGRCAGAIDGLPAFGRCAGADGGGSPRVRAVDLDDIVVVLIVFVLTRCRIVSFSCGIGSFTSPAMTLRWIPHEL